MRTWKTPIDRAALIVLLAAAAACTPEVEEVEKLDDRTRPTGLEAPNEGVTPVRAERPGSLLTGYLATGSQEDLLLASESSRFLFERNKDNDFQDAAPEGVWILPGSLIDAVGTSGGDDGLIALTTLLQFSGGPVNALAFEKVRVDEGSRGGAVQGLKTLKVPNASPSDEIEIENRAVLGRDQPHLILRTKVRNKGDKAVSIRLGDRMVFGPGPTFADAAQRLEAGTAKVRFVGHEVLPEAYGYTLDGKASFEAHFHILEHGTRTTTTAIDAFDEVKKVGPGDTIEFVRRFRATGNGMMDVRAWMAGLLGQKTGFIRGKLEAPRELTPDQFNLPIYDGNTLLGHLPVSSSLALDIPAPSGEYRVTPEGPWGLKVPPQKITVPNGGAAKVELSFVKDIVPVAIRVTDEKSRKPIPATIYVLDEQDKAVLLGHTALGSANGPYLYLPTGEGQLKLPPGKFRVGATRGPEYTLNNQEIKIEAGRPDLKVDLTLARRLNTEGYLLADLRAYSRLDMTGRSELKDLAAAMSSSGVEFGAVTNRDRPTWLDDGSKALGGQLSLRSVPAQEFAPISPDYSAFTLLPAGSPGAGAPRPPLTNVTADALLDQLRKLGTGSPFVSLIWPRTPSKSGYFDTYNIDRDTGAFARFGGSVNFDGFELASGGAVTNPCFMQDPAACNGREGLIAKALDEALRDWVALIGQGYRFTATGASGSRAVGLEPVGMPFTWIDLGARKDDPARLDPRDVLEALREMRAIPSTGPIIRFVGEGRGPGHLIPGLKRVRKGDKIIVIRGANLSIDVQAMSWAGFDTVVLYEDGAARESWEIEKLLKDGVQSWSTNLTVTPQEDRWYHVRVYGKNPLPNVPHMTIRPFAMSNPIWVDADGDGKWETKPLTETIDAPQ